MFFPSLMRINLFLPALLSVFFLVFTMQNANAASALTIDLQALSDQGSSINTQLSAMTLNTDSSCSEMDNISASVKSLITNIETVTANLTSPLSLDTDSLNALDDLSIVSVSLASVLPVLSADISLMAIDSDVADLQNSLDTMLRLSDDIGTMADRILEMSDKILVMADNIGLMADRILLTQQIQSTNMALTQSAILSTQTNMISLSGTVDTSAYNLPLSNLINTGNILSLDMNNTQLTSDNMNSELADFELRVKNYLNDFELFNNLFNSDNKLSSMFINGDSLSYFGDLSIANTALSDSLNRFALTINTLSPNTDLTVLNDSVYSMLRLSSDIGLMGGRIVEMGDDISIMADNIGVMTLRILATQTLQQSNLTLSQSNLTAAQISMVSLISTFEL